MSVLPFMASLPAALAGEGIAPEAASGDGAGFVEALAAALAPPVGVPPQAAATATASGGITAGANASVSASETPPPTPQLGTFAPAMRSLSSPEPTDLPLGVPLPGGTATPHPRGAPEGTPVPVVGSAAPAASNGVRLPGAPSGAGLTSEGSHGRVAVDQPGVVPPPASSVPRVPTTVPDDRAAGDLPTLEAADRHTPAESSSVTGAENPLRGVESPLRAVETPHSAVRAAVVQQVFPEVTRLTTGGNGTHRITLNLQPEQLGEVRVTLVVRDGTVTVSLGGEAGNGSVQQALASGAPELRRMLELAGATDTRIFVRDAQSMTSAGAQPQAETQPRHDQPTQGDWSRGQHRDGPGPGDHRQQSGREPGREPAPRGTAGVVPTPGLRPPTPGRLDRTI